MVRAGILALLLFAASLAQAGEPIEAPGRVTAVTVYQGQALVTREVDLPAGEGLAELVVTGLPERLLPGSLYAEGDDGVEVRSVRTRVRPASEAPREEVQQLQEKMKGFARQTADLKRKQEALTKHARYLEQVGKFSAGASTGDLQRGVLDAGALYDVTKLLFNERNKLADQESELKTDLEEVAAETQLVQRELNTLTQGGRQSTREAIVFVNKQAVAGVVRLRYLVGGASWSPSYNVRANESGDEVTLEYNASVTQMSGEDWTDVAMTLSTASPSLVATAPRLDPLSVRLVAAQRDKKSKSVSKLALQKQQRELALNRGNYVPLPVLEPESQPFSDKDGNSDPFSYDYFDEERSGGIGSGGGGFGAVYANGPAAIADWDVQLNAIGCAVQLSDFARSGRKAAEATLSDDRTEGVSVDYRLANRLSLPSRSDQQLVPIAKLPMKADVYRVATPVLTSYVYLEAELTNASEHVLLAGPAATFLGDRFVGRGELPTVAVGESFPVGLGIDESLRAGRELVDKTDRVQGGNRVVRLDYELTIENFGSEATTVRVLDRLPTSEGDAIKVTLVESTPDPSEGAEDRKEGLVRWDLETPAGESSVSYTLQIEHDKNLTITGK